MKNDIYNKELLLKSVRSGKRPKYMFFWGHQKRKDGTVGKECFSQWWSNSFEINSIVYKTAEHFMMAEKARLFKDEERLNKILSSRDPGAAKRFGREIRNFDNDLWLQNRFEIVVRGNNAKFSQNNELRKFLINTKDRVLVEASPVDKIWGIGLSEDDPHASNPEKWKGLNLLGFALMKVRSCIRENL
ncbi:MAG: NADAR family protein [Desulfobacterales bacterium]|nr:NADAR family protein [Desulfobacterales bacterium]MCP4160000.1 NADAR family protein [Deltaproteobacteria bacterium]